MENIEKCECVIGVINDYEDTNNKIIKAMECCSIPTLMSRKCEGCPMKVEGALCFSRLAHDTIHLIKRLQAEKADERAKKEMFIEIVARQDKEIANLEVELKAMRAAANGYKAEVEKLHPYKLHYGNLRMEIAREFADRLKAEAWIMQYCEDGVINRLISETNIDNLLKEMEKECDSV